MADLSKICERVFKVKCKVDIYGGEFIGFNYSYISDFLNLYYMIYEWNKDNNYILKTEEHIFSLILKKLNYNDDISRKYIKRIWTTITFNNVAQDDFKLPIWHLPAEKQVGLMILFKKLYGIELEEIDNLKFENILDKSIRLKKSKSLMKILDKIRMKKKFA